MELKKKKKKQYLKSFRLTIKYYKYFIQINLSSFKRFVYHFRYAVKQRFSTFLDPQRS